MTDPVAEAAAALAAAPSSTEPSLIEEIKHGMHDLAEKVEHLIHPETEAPKVEAPGETVAGPAEAARADTSATTYANAAASGETQADADVPNVPLASMNGIAGVSMPSAASGLKAVNETAASDIRSSVAAIKGHLHLFGFEASAVEKIHTELAAIEKWL